jgi:hypothetical protein
MYSTLQKKDEKLKFFVVIDCEKICIQNFENVTTGRLIASLYFYGINVIKLFFFFTDVAVKKLVSVLIRLLA